MVPMREIPGEHALDPTGICLRRTIDDRICRTDVSTNYGEDVTFERLPVIHDFPGM